MSYQRHSYLDTVSYQCKGHIRVGKSRGRLATCLLTIQLTLYISAYSYIDIRYPHCKAHLKVSVIAEDIN